ncbi:hypothetical protein [Reinekea sp. G2M2-21]|uniref:hypothetical protein n=1 Tax=Reinekea sp. G2M2-21 TaxID=2788942 RepID=UPI0018ABEB8B|nr:hypothetical protein [Reinekea sp. G2M2-21]
MPSAGKTISITVVIFLLSVSLVLYLASHKKDIFLPVVVDEAVTVSELNRVDVLPLSVAIQPQKTVSSVEAGTPVAEQKEETIDEVLQLEDRNENYPTVGDRVSTVVARRHGQVYDAVKIWQASQSDTAWKAVHSIPDGLNLSVEQQLDGREFIQIDPLKIESLVQGDRFEIAIAQANQTYLATVEEVRSEDDGRSVTWSGTLQGIDPPNTFSITRGNRLIVAGIATPQALYSLQADGEYGWIVDSATLFVGGDEPIEVTPDMNLPHAEHTDS